MIEPKQIYCRKCIHYRNEWCEPTRDSPDPDIARDCAHYKSMTNADLIRGMTDEELAEKIVMCRDADIFRETVLGTRMNTIWEWLDWLKQEVQE